MKPSLAYCIRLMQCRSVWCAQFSQKDKGHLCVGTYGRPGFEQSSLKVINVESSDASLIAQCYCNDTISSLSFHPCGDLIFFASGCQVNVWFYKQNVVRQLFITRSPVYKVTATNDGIMFSTDRLSPPSTKRAKSMEDNHKRSDVHYMVFNYHKAVDLIDDPAALVEMPPRCVFVLFYHTSFGIL
eukprot:TRINITY_DN3935_c0_g4_i1.p1 TRINITY_DN3935_c0_g4~~TRINITY_DN3935_c0_g4_i1.p1  ORF type:complete len:208 (+),score=14.35 TRINITY_DN3935_c0_g4_i1:72-626(+)